MVLCSRPFSPARYLSRNIATASSILIPRRSFAAGGPPLPTSATKLASSCAAAWAEPTETVRYRRCDPAPAGRRCVTVSSQTPGRTSRIDPPPLWPRLLLLLPFAGLLACLLGDTQVIDANAGGFVRTGQDPHISLKGSMRKLPCNAVCGQFLALDAHPAGSRIGPDGPTPQVVFAAPIDQPVEALLQRSCHPDLL